MAPFFSGGKIQGYAATIAHHVDIGGYAPGGYCISTELYQEGIIIPPAKLVSEGEIVDDVFRLILANIRSPRQSTGDFRAQIAASLLGQKRMAEILTRFGAESVEIFVDELIEYTERWARAEISKLPDGVYEAEALLDDDGVSDRPIRLVLKVQIKEGRVSFDLTGTDAQRSSPMNATLTQTYSPLAYVVKCLIDSDIPTNEGFYRLIDVKAPPGTVVNAIPPVGVVGGWEVVMRLCCLGFKALADAMPDKVMASTKSINCHMACGGTDPRTGEYYTFIETMAGGWGGLPTKDGMDAVQSHVQNTENSAIEETENNLPFLITRYELIPDSEGAGRYRGGLGLRRDWMFPGHEATLTVFSDNRKFAPWGLFGGGERIPLQIHSQSGRRSEGAPLQDHASAPTRLRHQLPDAGRRRLRASPGSGPRAGAGRRGPRQGDAGPGPRHLRRRPGRDRRRSGSPGHPSPASPSFRIPRAAVTLPRGSHRTGTSFNRRWTGLQPSMKGPAAITLSGYRRPK